MVTVAREAIASPDAGHNRIELSMQEPATHEMGKDGDGPRFLIAKQQSRARRQSAQPGSLRAAAMNTRELIRYHGPDWLESKIELHKRFALPLACFVLAMVGIPLGVTTRKGGKSAALYQRHPPRVLLLLPFVHHAGESGKAARAAGPDRALAAQRSARPRWA